ncbi:MAG: alpha/beta fold hydrolase [Ilumatobacter sp.]|nr:alpha/beta fold hydrolase [Ilumatobacter sp.]
MATARPRVTRRSPRRRSSSATLAGLALALAACSDSAPPVPAPATREITTVPTTVAPAPTTVAPGEPAPTTTAAPEPLEYTIDWEQLGGRVEAGMLSVPLDYADPQGDTIELYVTRHRAKESGRIGALLVNNGGPGSPASSMGIDAPSWFASPITDRFDVVAWDPRGTGVSGGSVDCIDDDEYDRFYSAIDITPEDDAEREELVELAEEFAERCVARVGEPLQYIGTNNSARDMDAIRQALGEEQVSYFGFSYGSELGGVWATLFPLTVRAAVFDGAADPEADSLEQTRQQWMGFESALNTFLDACSDDSSCRFHNDGDAASAFDDLLVRLDDEPLPGPGERVDVNLGVAVTGVVRAMYSDQFWPVLERALEDAAEGDGTGLLQLQDAYFQRSADGTYSNLLEAFQAISCADDRERPTVEESDEQAAELLTVAPRLFPYTTGSYSCTFFPPALDPRIEITGVGAGPIVVIGTTGDPSTPLSSSRNMAAALEDGRLVIVEANQHTGYGVNSCIDDVVHDYLVQLAAPPTETVCS